MVSYYYLNGAYTKILYWYGSKITSTILENNIQYFGIDDHSSNLKLIDAKLLTSENIRIKSEIPKDKFKLVDKNYKNFLSKLIKENNDIIYSYFKNYLTNNK